MRGSRVEADVAMIWDWESWWAQELEWRPSQDLDYLERIRAWYEASWRAGLTVDFAHPTADLGRYRLVVVPSLYLTTPEAAANLRRNVAGGGTLLVSCFSGIVDAWDRVYPGSYPGALRDVLGVTVEERLPLRAGERAGLAWEEGDGVWSGSADCWTEAVKLAGAKSIVRYSDGPAAGGPPSPGTTSATVRHGTCPRARTPRPRPPCSPRPASRPASPAHLKTAHLKTQPWHTQAPRTRSARLAAATGHATWRSCAARTGSGGSSRSSTTGNQRGRHDR